MDLGVGELELGLLKLGQQLVVLALGLVARGTGVVEFGLGGGFLVDQRCLAGEFDLGAVEASLGDGHRGLGGVDPGLIWSLLDHIEEVSRLHRGALGEVLLLEETFDAGEEVNLLKGLDPGGEADGGAKVLRFDLDHGDGGDGGGRGSLLLFRAVAATSEHA